jgi:hypothetical protein
MTNVSATYPNSSAVQSPPLVNGYFTVSDPMPQEPVMRSEWSMVALSDEIGNATIQRGEP